MNLLAWQERLTDRVAQRRIDEERSLVTEGQEAERRLILRASARMIFGLGALLLAMWGPDVVVPFTWPVLGYLIGSSAMTSLRAPQAYRSGWIRGRSNMAESVHQTGTTLQAFEYDAVHVMGMVSPTVPDTPEGLE